MASLPLNAIADVVYNLPAIGGTRRGFNLGLIIGDSAVIDTYSRVKVYANLQEMIDDGFTNSDPEYLAAQVYFAAIGRPSQVAIGRQASGETALAAVQACRESNSDWYMVYVPSATNSDHEDIAGYIEALTDTYSVYAIQSADADILTDAPGNIFATLSAANYRRTIGMYSTEADAIASIMGFAMSNTRDAAGSSYTLKFKQLPGIAVEALNSAQVANVEGNNGNVYINRGIQYDGFENGTMFSGDWFDEIIGLDKLVNDVQISVANLLYQTPKVPQTEDGMAQIRAVVSSACDRSVTRGFLAAGEWTGLPVLTLNTGDFLPDGFLVLSEAIADQSQQDREARLAPNTYVAAKLAGAIQSVFIQINVNR